IEAGTMTAELVAYCWTSIAHGASFLTAARPGGAGKSTVLANLLALLPPGEEIATFCVAGARNPPQSSSMIEAGGVQAPALQRRRCELAHEIGSGHWYGYIWGTDVARFLSLTKEQRVASCLHADTLEELYDILRGAPLNVPERLVQAVDLILFVHVLPGRERRVAAVYEATGEGHRLAFALEGGQLVRQDAVVLPGRLGAGAGEMAQRLQAVQRMLDTGERRFEVLRERVLECY
ncbi:MAG: hypothetical protein ABFD94_09890, partial [Armatimonadia bacterium]